MMRWEQRKYQHDTVMDSYDAWLRSLGFRVFEGGIEVKPELAELLRVRYDPTSRMLRYRPDRILVSDGAGTVLLEYKTEPGRYQNFSIEIDSYAAACQWAKAGATVFYIFAAPDANKACWSHDIRFDTVFIPSRWGDDVVLRLKREWPTKRIRRTKWRAGASGTPFFLVPKSAPYLKPLKQFIENDVLPSLGNEVSPKTAAPVGGFLA